MSDYKILRRCRTLTAAERALGDALNFVALHTNRGRRRNTLVVHPTTRAPLPTAPLVPLDAPHHAPRRASTQRIPPGHARGALGPDGLRLRADVHAAELPLHACGPRDAAHARGGGGAPRDPRAQGPRPEPVRPACLLARSPADACPAARSCPRAPACPREHASAVMGASVPSVPAPLVRSSANGKERVARERPYPGSCTQSC